MIIDNLIESCKRLRGIGTQGRKPKAKIMTPEQLMQAKRRATMAVLVHADTAELANRVAALPAPPHRAVREPESGLVMVRGRVGGDGAPFNFGEATVSRAAVRLDSGEVGFGYVLGRDGEKARLIALCDALIQSTTHADALETDVVAPLRGMLDARRGQRAAQAAATKVDFYTMVRGEG
jgi:alpha-D-ribose 1-methylphosphonate 5-triphosphate synthase subunit PhnG